MSLSVWFSLRESVFECGCESGLLSEAFCFQLGRCLCSSARAGQAGEELREEGAARGGEG